MTVSYERRYYSVGWNSVVSTPRARAKAPFSSPHPSLAVSRPSPLPSPILPPPLRRHLPLWSLSLCPCLYLSLSDFSELPLILYYHLSPSCIVVLSSVFLPSHPATPANSRSLRPTLRLSLSLTKTLSFRRAPFAGRTLVLSLLLPLA